ncbi:hypothetical protein EAF04_005870 [Stromatinia cepivora]|nr:hypothetical protein EAF04_005870 [Stromatinia cepivora]
MDIGDGSFIRHFVLRAIKIMRRDIRTIEDNELKYAKERENQGYTTEEDFTATADCLTFGFELGELEQELRDRESGHYPRPSVKSECASESMNSEAGSMTFTRMLRCSMVGLVAMSQILKSIAPHAQCIHYTRMVRSIDSHLDKLKYILLNSLCSIFPVRLCYGLIDFWVKATQETPMDVNPVQKVISALKIKKHVILNEIQELLEKNLEKISQQWNGSANMYQISVTEIKSPPPVEETLIEAPVEEVQEETPATSHQVSVVILSAGAAFKYWGLFFKDEENERGGSKSFILHIKGSSGRFYPDEEFFNASGSKNLFRIIRIGSIEGEQVHSAMHTIKNVEIKNHVKGWNCQDFVLDALKALEEQGFLDHHLVIIPDNYKISWYHTKEELTDRPQPLPIKHFYVAPDFCADLVARARTATIIHPLSTETVSCLIVHLDSSSSAEDLTSNQCLVSALKHLIVNSEKLCELPMGGVVLKCSDHLVAKIIRNNDYTEYTLLQYLQDNAPALLAPKPHGLVKLNNVHIIFMTYIPSVTLEQVWGTLTHDNKLLIQSQLDEIFVRLRLLSHDSQCLGGDRGEGVKIDGAFGIQLHKKAIISTAKDFDNFCFSAVSHRASTSWVNFVRSLLPAWEDNFVFGRGDLRPANIMVKPGGGGGNYVLSSVINWGDGGFYPDYFESSKLLYTFGMQSEDDWYAYLPPSISPATHPQRWLVERIWRYTLECC